MRRMLVLGAVVVLAGCGGQTPDEALTALRGYCGDGSTSTPDARKAIDTVVRDGSPDQKIAAGLMLYCDQDLSKTFFAALTRERLAEHIDEAKGQGFSVKETAGHVVVSGRSDKPGDKPCSVMRTTSSQSAVASFTLCLERKGYKQP